MILRLMTWYEATLPGPLVESDRAGSTAAAILEPSELMGGERDGAAEEKELSQVEETTTLPLIRICINNTIDMRMRKCNSAHTSGIIAEGINDASEDVDMTKSSTDFLKWRKECYCFEHFECRIHLAK
jgi:hypothetical protein